MMSSGLPAIQGNPVSLCCVHEEVKLGIQMKNSEATFL